MTAGAPSRRGLFRAFGKANAGDARPRDPLDFVPTVQSAPIAGLVAAEGARMAAFPALWEPAAGDGTMARDLRAFGFRCRLSDIADRGCGARARDFFAFRRPLAPAIVTNPPFSAVNWAHGRGRWITHALEALGVEFMALLLPFTWPAAAGLGAIWSTWPPARVWLMRWRVDWTGGGAPPMATAWFVWDAAAPPASAPLLLMMDRPEGLR